MGVGCTNTLFEDITLVLAAKCLLLVASWTTKPFFFSLFGHHAAQCHSASQATKLFQILTS